ncbi:MULTISPECIES: YusW family protein [Bacillus]|uniref:YusW family protein n=1 Tax=Bacillus TaxID=1386 RepID=UPI00098A35C2|nr:MULTISPECIES: YusW family protein [Bacillus]WFA04532.1 YusW family protein [Bacillus sp. HSf4]
MNVFRIACFLVSVVLLNGCQSVAEQQAEGEETIGKDAPVADVNSIPFDRFVLKVSYGDGKHNTFEASYAKQEREEAEIIDRLNDLDREGEEALNEMKMVLSELSIAKSDSQSDVIRYVLEAFNLDEGYDRFQLQVKWPDGTAKRYTGKS